MSIVDLNKIIHVYVNEVFQAVKTDPNRKICDLIEDSVPKDSPMRRRVLKECENRIIKLFRREKADEN